MSAPQLDGFGELGCRFWVGTMAGDGVSDWSGLTSFRRTEWSLSPVASNTRGRGHVDV